MFLFFIYKGRHCCLFCNTTNANMQPPKSRQEKNSQRTLKTLANKLNTFREAGNDLKFAKFHDNVIDDVMFNVELDQVNDIILLCANLQHICQKKTIHQYSFSTGCSTCTTHFFGIVSQVL